VTVANWYTLKTHLKGRKPKGHVVPEMDAEAIAKAVFNGTYPFVSSDHEHQALNVGIPWRMMGA